MATLAVGGLGGIGLQIPVVSGSLSSNSRHGNFSTVNLSLLRWVPVKRMRRDGRGSRRFGLARAGKDEEVGDRNQDSESNKGEKGSVDWDKAWSSYSKPLKKKSFLKLDMEQYVTRRPTHSNYPLSEEVDPLRKSERSALGVWTSLNFTYAFVVVIIGLVVYMVIIVGPPPHH